MLAGFDKDGCGFNILSGGRYPWRWKVNNPLGDNCPHPSVKEGLGRFFLEKIAVCHSGCAGEDHFRCCQFAAPVDHFPGDKASFGREDMALQPLHQG